MFRIPWEPVILFNIKPQALVLSGEEIGQEFLSVSHDAQHAR